ncbi:MAG: DUF2147 domain-containing protein [Proteobacteria bacterium]|nr:DUF2147 domain-containing protein [Pseudomonadota bacterium]
MNRIGGLVGLLAAATCCAAGVAHAAGDPVFGVWLTAAKDGKVRIAPCAADAAETCGVVVWGRGPNGEDARTLTDVKNPDPARRAQPIVGLQIISGFRRDGEGGWTGGRIYEPQTGRTFKAKMASKGPNGLKVSGCVLVFCRAESWTRTTE